MGRWIDFLSTTVATIIGAWLGFWGALYVNRRQGIAQRKGLSEKEYERKKRIYKQIIEELNLNKQILDRFAGVYLDYPGEVIKFDDVEGATIGLLLRDEVWRAFSATGELRWVDDSSVLFSLAGTYHNINLLKNLSYNYYDLTIRGVLRSPNYAIEYTNKEIKRALIDAVDDTERTIAYLREYMGTGFSTEAWWKDSPPQRQANS